MLCNKILVTGAPIHEQAQQRIVDLGYQSYYLSQLPDRDSLRSVVAEIDPVAILVRTGSISATVIAAAPSLRVISKHGVGVDNIDIVSASSRGIPVLVTVGANSQMVAEHAAALMLAVVKDLPQLDMGVREGRWEKSSFVGRDLHGMQLGLVGFGSIAQRFAPLALAMGMRVQAYDPFVPNSKMDAAGVDYAVNLDALLRQADVVSLHCPLTADNQKFLNEKTIGSMQQGSFVINTARGALIDENALVAALKTGQITAAGLDTFALEPPAREHPYFDLPNVILSPHIAGCTATSIKRVGLDAVEGIHAVLSGEPLSPARIVNSSELASVSVTEESGQVNP